MTLMVCMTVPSGRSVVAARGRGNWKAMKTAANKARPGNAGSIHTAADVLREGMMPTPGLAQCIVPLIDDMWIQPVHPSRRNGPSPLNNLFQMESARRTGNVPSIPPSSSNPIDVFPLGPFPSCPAFPSEETPREPSAYFLYSLAMNREALLGLLSGGLVAGIGLWLLYRKRGWVDVSPQLRTMSVSRMKYLLAGTFFFGAAIAFVMDLFNGTLMRPVVIGFALLFGSIFCLSWYWANSGGWRGWFCFIPLGALVYYIQTHNAGTAALGHVSHRVSIRRIRHFLRHGSLRRIFPQAHQHRRSASTPRRNRTRTGPPAAKPVVADPSVSGYSGVCGRERLPAGERGRR